MWDFLSACGCQCLIRGRSPVGQANLAIFPWSIYFPPLPVLRPFPQRWGSAEARGSCVGLLAHIDHRGLSCLWCTAFVTTHSCFPCSAPTQPWVEVPFVLTADHGPQYPPPYSFVGRQCPRAGSAHVVSWHILGMRCGGASAISFLCCFWCAAWVSTNNSCYWPAQAPPWDWVASASCGWVFSLVVASLDPVSCSDMEWAGLEHLLGSSLGACWGMGSLAAAREVLSWPFLPCLRGKPAYMFSSWAKSRLP